MKKLAPLALVAILLACSDVQQSQTQLNTTSSNGLQYPVTAKVDSVDTYFGEKIPDPYRWLEDDRSEETAQWVKAQNEVTFGYLDKIPFRGKIKDRLTEIWNYEKFGAPYREGDHYFFFKNDGLQDQSVVYIQDGLDKEPRVFLDPNKFSEDGTTSLTDFSISKDGKYCGYGIAKGGSDWNEFHVMEVETGRQLKDELKWIKFSGLAWKDNGFYYSRYDEPLGGSELSTKNEFHKVFYHKIGTDQSADQLIYEDKDHPLRNFSASTTEDERFLILYGSETTSGNSLYFKDLKKKGSPFVEVATTFEHDYWVIDSRGDKLLVMTNNGAPNKRLVLIDTKAPQQDKWKDLIPERKEVLMNVTLAGGKIIGTYLKDAYSMALIYDQNGMEVGQMDLPGIGNMGGLRGKKEDAIAFYTFSSYTVPTTVYQYDIATNTSTIHFQPEVKFNPGDYETKQVFYKSKDGTKIPMFITHKKGLQMDGKNPTLLYGYGGFNISITPRFSTSNMILLENGGVYAVANLRGGGEYGEEWHDAGTKLNKQNVFDDFIAAAEYLIQNNYTSKEFLAINGRSNGGLLVGATMTQRPDLFQVAFPAVGVLDMLRFHKFTIGWAWVRDYGSSDNEAQFHALLKYSPLHNVKAVAYPATMVTTADHDDRVVPAHSFKFISTLQEKHTGDKPVLIRVETMAGHGAGMPTSKRIEEAADMWAFMFYNMNMTVEYM